MAHCSVCRGKHVVGSHRKLTSSEIRALPFEERIAHVSKRAAMREKAGRSAGSELTADQLRAVIAYARENGPRWKSALRSDWYSASARIRGEVSPELQQIRNSLGPSWLNRFRLREAMQGYSASGGYR